MSMCQVNTRLNGPFDRRPTACRSPVAAERRGSLWRSCAVLLAFGCVAMTGGRAEEGVDDGPTKLSVPVVPRVVVATVGAAELLQAELDAWTSQLPRARDADPAQRAALHTQTLEAVVQQQLVAQHLARERLGATVAEVDLAMQRWQQRLQARRLQPSEFYARTGLDEQAMRRRFAWNIGWPRLCHRRLTDAALREFFAAHRRDFDGTKLNVAHILWKIPSPAGDAEPQQRLIQRAANLSERIRQGELTFAEAAATHSEAPSAAQGGVVGWIGRHAPMEESFTRAAFALEPGELSPPVLSPFGVHLIQCLEIQQGAKTFEEVAHDVRTTVSRLLFRELAERERSRATIVMTRPAAGAD